MSFMQELKSWTYGGYQVDVKGVPSLGQPAPSGAFLKFPRADGKPAIVNFMRHCGCPFAERDFRTLRDFAAEHPEIACIAVSHSSQSHTDTWLKEVEGPGNVEVIVDESRQTHGDWGLGKSGWGHVLSYSSFSSLYSLGKEKNIWNRPTETGSRWQAGGYFAVDGSGTVKWEHIPVGAEEEPKWTEAQSALESKSKL